MTKILIADDDAAIVDALGYMLEDEGYAVVKVTNTDILASAKRELPDLVLLDIWMSGRDGRIICRALKQHPSTSHIPILMVSAHHDGPAIAREAGADGFVAKPFEIDDLLAKVAALTEAGIAT